MLRKLENASVYFIPHIFTKGHVRLVVGKKVYNFGKMRLDKAAFNQFLSLLKLDGTLVNVGAPPKPLSLNVFNLLGN
jgi:hypothetical protein